MGWVGLGWVGLGWVNIHCCGNGGWRFRPYGESLFQTPKRNQKALPHHSVPRLGSACPLSGIPPWAAAMGRPWPSAAKPASCRFTHGAMPAFGQRGLTGRPDQNQKRGGLIADLTFQNVPGPCGSGLAPGGVPTKRPLQPPSMLIDTPPSRADSHTDRFPSSMPPPSACYRACRGHFGFCARHFCKQRI